MKGKKETAKNKAEAVQPSGEENFRQLTTKAELKAFLTSIRDKITEGAAAPIYAMSAINYVLTHPDVYTLLDNENKEIARDIWLRLKQGGMQLRSPTMLFGDEQAGA